REPFIGEEKVDLLLVFDVGLMRFDTQRLELLMLIWRGALAVIWGRSRVRAVALLAVPWQVAPLVGVGTSGGTMSVAHYS
ncbi:hypothetical protein PSY24_23305, partial [Shigella flexneri]|nr:hypothetical protein [Shigella flexneri]